MSLAAVIHALLVFVPTEGLAEDTRLEVVILDGLLEVRESKQPQKVSTLPK